MSKPYAEVIGDPIAHSKSPLIHRFWLEKVGIEADYVATQVRPDELAAHVARRREDPDWRGSNITVPHKQAIVPLLDTLWSLAAEVGAVNTIVVRDEFGLVGANTDVEGIVEAIPKFEPGTLKQACVIGSGGAALAALAAIRLLGAERVVLNVRDRTKGQSLLASWGFQGRVGLVDDADNIAGAQLIINASTLGMVEKDPMPEALLDHIRTHPDDCALVFDMVYAPLETDLLLAARQRGLRTADGLAMLIAQAAAAFWAFFGMPPPREDDAELRRLLTS